jgi:hypothetical protein
MMDGQCVLIVVGNKAWYHWSAWKAVVASSQDVRTYALRDVRALSIPLAHKFEGLCCGVVIYASVVVTCFSSRAMDRGNVDTF